MTRYALRVTRNGCFSTEQRDAFHVERYAGFGIAGLPKDAVRPNFALLTVRPELVERRGELKDAQHDSLAFLFSSIPLRRIDESGKIRGLHRYEEISRSEISVATTSQ